MFFRMWNPGFLLFLKKKSNKNPLLDIFFKEELRDLLLVFTSLCVSLFSMQDGFTDLLLTDQTRKMWCLVVRRPCKEGHVFSSEAAFPRPHTSLGNKLENGSLRPWKDADLFFFPFAQGIELTTSSLPDRPCALSYIPGHHAALEDGPWASSPQPCHTQTSDSQKLGKYKL